MWTKKQVLVTSKGDGTIQIVAMRYNASHQRGWRCFLSPLADDPAAIHEETVSSFHGRSLFDAPGELSRNDRTVRWSTSASHGKPTVLG